LSVEDGCALFFLPPGSCSAKETALSAAQRPNPPPANEVFDTPDTGFGFGIEKLHRAVFNEIRAHDAELELELIQTQMTQKPMLRAEVYARALRASQNRKEDSV